MKKYIYIIVPAYNMSNYIGNCLDSIINQTYHNFKVIVIDDASTDRTIDIIRQYSDLDSRISFIHLKKNGGVANARNMALDFVMNSNDAGYICFIDADDYIHPDYLKILLQKQECSDVDIVWCQPNNTTQLYIDAKFGSVNADTSKDTIISGKKLLLKEEYRIMYSMVWGKLFKANLWTDVRFPEKLKYYEDGATTFKAIYKADKVLITDLKLYNYYYSPNSATRSSSSKEKCECGLATSIEKIQFYQAYNEFNLLNMAYVGYANTVLKNIRESNIFKDKKYRHEMLALYKKIYLKAVKCNNISIGQKIKFIIYRIFPGIQSYYIKIKMLKYKMRG